MLQGKLLLNLFQLKDMALYVLLTLVIFIGMNYANELLPVWGAIGVNTLLLLIFAGVIVVRDLPSLIRRR